MNKVENMEFPHLGKHCSQKSCNKYGMDVVIILCVLQRELMSRRVFVWRNLFSFRLEWENFFPFIDLLVSIYFLTFRTSWINQPYVQFPFQIFMTTISNVEHFQFSQIFFLWAAMPAIWYFGEYWKPFQSNLVARTHFLNYYIVQIKADSCS